MNDMEMIENAGLGVIMGNSAEYMHEFADVVAQQIMMMELHIY